MTGTANSIKTVIEYDLKNLAITCTWIASV